MGAHINGIETFPFFAAAVLLAEFRSQPQHLIDVLAVAFVVVRLAFVAAYLGNRSTVRTLLWNLGFAVNTAIFFLPWWGPRRTGLEDTPSAPVLAALSLFARCSFASFYATRGTPLPSFVVAIALGIAGYTLFSPIAANTTALAALLTGSAAIILFSGGLEMPLRQFVRLLVKVALLAFPGVIVTGYALSYVLQGLGGWFGIALAPAVVILLGAILAPTDPAAIIPVLRHVRFKRRATKDIVVAESALNDVVGALLTSVFLKLSLVAMTSPPPMRPWPRRQPIAFSRIRLASVPPSASPVGRCCGFCRRSSAGMPFVTAPTRSTFLRHRSSPSRPRSPLAAAAFLRPSSPASTSTRKSTWPRSSTSSIK